METQTKWEYTPEEIAKYEVTKRLKLEIKKLSTDQTYLKNQRKTINLVGERTTKPFDAWNLHNSNRFDLRHMYIIYGELRGKSLDQIESNSKTKLSEHYLTILREQYSCV